VIQRIQGSPDVQRFFQIFQFGKVTDADRANMKQAIASSLEKDKAVAGGRGPAGAKVAEQAKKSASLAETVQEKQRTESRAEAKPVQPAGQGGPPG